MTRRAIVLSDTHLGTPESDPDGLRSFLLSLRPDARHLDLVLNGDILDLWRGEEARVLEASRGVLEAVAELISEGASVSWVPGNHDFAIRRALDEPASTLLRRLPSGIAFHHPYKRLVQAGKPYLITHGDVCDFLFVPLEMLGPISWALSPADVYAFYDFVHALDKDLVAGYDRAGTRGLFLAWLSEVWRGLWFGSAEEPTPEASPALDAIALRVGRSLTLDAQALAERFADVPLDEVGRRVGTSLGWGDTHPVSPWPRRASRRGFRECTQLVVGHFHDPRQGFYGPRSIMDDGSWWHGPGRGGTYVEISQGRPFVREWP